MKSRARRILRAMRVRAGLVLRRAAVACAGVAAALACYAPTQIDVEISTDLDCEAVRAGGIAIFVADTTAELGERAPAATTNRCAPRGQGDAEIGSLFLTPGGSRDASVVVEVVAGVTRPPGECARAANVGCIVSRRRVAYVPHKTVTLKVTLQRSCLGISCGADQTCWQGRCASLSACEGEACGQAPDAGVDLPPPLVCPAGRGDCDGNGANGCEADLLSSAAHCGACGHDCGGAACNEGVCAPLTLFSADMPSAIAVDGTDVYVTRTLPVPNGAVLACSVNGCGAPTVLATGLNRPDAIAADTARIYWSDENGSSIEACARPACTGRKSLGNDGARSLALTTSAIFFTSRFNYYAGRAGYDGGATALLWPNTDPIVVTTDEAAIFVATLGYGTVGGGLFRCPHVGGCTVIGAPPNLPFEAAGATVLGLAVDATHVYWTERSAGRVMRAAKDLTGAGSALLLGAQNPGKLVVDDTFVYWVDEGTGNDDGAIRRARKDGSLPVVLAKGQQKPTGLALLGTRLFWTNNVTGGAVRSVVAR
jgi:hypothetical protein